MKLSGNTVLITGGSGGIGLEFAKQLSELGNTVIITGRNQAKLDYAKKQYPNIVTYRSDVTNPDDIRSLYSEVTKEFPALNILINNAGVMRVTKFYSPNEDLTSVTQEITTNLNGPIWMSHQFIPHLKKQKNAAIVNVASLLGFIPLPMSPVYSATKAGLRSFTTCLREQLKHTKVKVFDLSPPATQTDLVEVFDKKDVEGLKLMDAESVVKAALQGMQKDSFEIRPGQTNQVYYLGKFAPKVLLKMMSKSLDRMLQVDGSP
jgi:uncharacterized oxidoreductase